MTPADSSTGTTSSSTASTTQEITSVRLMNDATELVLRSALQRWDRNLELKQLYPHYV